MIRAAALSALSAGLVLAVGLAASTTPEAQERTALRPVSDFDSIADRSARSVALFEEAGKVLQHPRCVNCHPAGDRPLQGNAMRPHEPPVFRGDADFGLPAMTCNTCHGVSNVNVVGQADDIQSIPGHPNWHVAPIEMAWEGRTLGEICAQITDPERNGGKDIAALVEHMAQDSLVGWGWNPGAGRQPVPGTQEEFGALFHAWADTGAVCPPA